MTTFTSLDIWKVGIELTKEIYLLTKKFPREEIYGLTSQMRRAVTSILANIAEGCGRYTYADKAAKFVISRGECTEVEAFLRIAIALEFLTEAEASKALYLTQRSGKLVSGLIISTKNRSRVHQ